MLRMIAAECGWTGRDEMSSFHGLSGGKICIAARMRSASGVSNITGAVIGGSSPAATMAPESTQSQHGSSLTRSPLLPELKLGPTTFCQSAYVVLLAAAAIALPKRQTRGLVGIAGLGEADAIAGFREHARHDRRQRVVHVLRQPQRLRAASGTGGPADRGGGSRAGWSRSVPARRGPLPDAASLRPDRSGRRHRGCIPDRRSACSAGRGCRR